MAAEIQAQHAIDVDEIPDLYGGSRPSVQDRESRHGPRNKIMYETAAALVAMQGFRLQFAMYMIALLFIDCYIMFARKKHFKNLQEHLLWGIKVGDWIKFLLCTLIFVPINNMATCGTLTIFKRFVLLRKNVLYFVHGLKIKVHALICLFVAIIAWFLCLRQPNGQRGPASDFVFHTVISLFVGSALWLINSTLLLVLASSFCFNSFFDRAKESLAHEYVITALSGPPQAAPVQRDQDEIIGKRSVFECTCGIIMKGLYACACPVMNLYKYFRRGRKLGEVKVDIRELMKVPRDEVPLYTRQLLVEAISDSVTWTFQENGPRFMNNEQGASKAAPVIFRNVAKPGNSYIELEDLKRFLTEDILALVLPMLEVEQNGHIILQSFSAWMVKAYNFRMVLKCAVADSKKLFKRLQMVTDGILIIGVVLLWLGWVKIVKWNIMIIIFTQIATAGFIFGDSVKKVFEGAVFLFAVHPFDVGDCCVIGGIPVVIENMSILTTTVKKFDTQSMYYPNTVLATLPISNYTRSPHMADFLEFSIDLMTPEEKIEQLRHKIKRCLENNAYHWQPEYSLVTKEIDCMDKMKMVLNFNHTISFREFAVRDVRRFALIMELRKIFKELKLKTEASIS